MCLGTPKSTYTSRLTSRAKVWHCSAIPTEPKCAQHRCCGQKPACTLPGRVDGRRGRPRRADCGGHGLVWGRLVQTSRSCITQPNLPVHRNNHLCDAGGRAEELLNKCRTIAHRALRTITRNDPGELRSWPKVAQPSCSHVAPKAELRPTLGQFWLIRANVG